MIGTGLELLLTEYLPALRGKRLGVLANHASVTGSLTHMSDALVGSGLDVAALFGPEHGVRGDAAEGAHVADSIDERLGVPVYSLYGVRRRPDLESLQGIDIMLVDLQDIGARFYTFIYTMGEVMAACGEAGIPVWVLDRPNPITGAVSEGPVCLPEFSYASFGGRYRLPVRHGLTIGELARLFVSRRDVECGLRVIEMRGWSRDMWFDQTGLCWVMPSPNMPTLETAVVYPGLCLIEGTNLSEGRGTAKPFELFGAPWLDAPALREMLEDLSLPGALFREAYFTPHCSKYAGERCAGLQIHVTDRRAFEPVLAGVCVVSCIIKLHGDRLEFTRSGDRFFFDVLCGTDTVRKALLDGVSARDIADSWKDSLRSFSQEAEPALLY